MDVKKTFVKHFTEPVSATRKCLPKSAAHPVLVVLASIIVNVIPRSFTYHQLALRDRVWIIIDWKHELNNLERGNHEVESSRGS